MVLQVDVLCYPVILFTPIRVVVCFIICNKTCRFMVHPGFHVYFGVFHFFKKTPFWHFQRVVRNSPHEKK